MVTILNKIEYELNGGISSEQYPNINQINNFNSDKLNNLLTNC